MTDKQETPSERRRIAAFAGSLGLTERKLLLALGDAGVPRWVLAIALQRLEPVRTRLEPAIFVGVVLALPFVVSAYASVWSFAWSVIP